MGQRAANISAGRPNGGCHHVVTLVLVVPHSPTALQDGLRFVGSWSRNERKKYKVARVAIGCGHDNEGLFIAAGGLLGVGRGKLSFPSNKS
uniref:Xylanase inhibitor N-terminal domain-containing protein n=1 Tax=Oryza brachyantha TaxID=4533 RepID=J3MAB0_ORYBR